MFEAKNFLRTYNHGGPYQTQKLESNLKRNFKWRPKANYPYLNDIWLSCHHVTLKAFSVFVIQGYFFTKRLTRKHFFDPSLQSPYFHIVTWDDPNVDIAHTDYGT